jgi:glycosyltransferase involved in cell wall biosynthesis
MSVTIQDLTIVIPVKNEGKNLTGCLESIGKNFAAKIVLVDSASTDDTRLIASRFEVEIIDFSWNGQFPKKRNWYLRNHAPQTKWVLFLDADEYLTEDFKEQVCQSLSRDNYCGYWLSYSVYFLGRKLKGGYPLNKLALFQVGSGEYERIDELQWSHLDMEIHEHPVLNGRVGTIKSKIDHRDFRGISHYVHKHDQYASWEASRYLKIKTEKRYPLSWTWKQKLKYQLIATPFIGPVFFVGSFVLMGGFRDGGPGMAFAFLKLSYFTEIYCKIKESESTARSKANTLGPAVMQEV